MNSLLSALTLLAENPPDPAAGEGSPSMVPFVTQILMFASIGLVFYFLLMRPQKKEQTRRLTMLAALKNNDRVLTTSGIYGVVTNVHREANQVTIRVDETANTKIRMTLGSIAQVLDNESSEGTESK